MHLSNYNFDASYFERTVISSWI